MKYGENGKGIISRWYPRTLAKRINAIKHFQNKITFIQEDGMKIIVDNFNTNNTFFLDPPYTARGKKPGIGSIIITSSIMNYYFHSVIISIIF